MPRGGGGGGGGGGVEVPIVPSSSMKGVVIKFMNIKEKEMWIELFDGLRVSRKSRLGETCTKHFAVFCFVDLATNHIKSRFFTTTTPGK